MYPESQRLLRLFNGAGEYSISGQASIEGKLAYRNISKVLEFGPCLVCQTLEAG